MHSSGIPFCNLTTTNGVNDVWQMSLFLIRAETGQFYKKKSAMAKFNFCSFVFSPPDG